MRSGTLSGHMLMQDSISFFSKNDPYYELSNFAPYGFEESGVYWPTVEHYYQAQKFEGSEYGSYRERIRQAGSPKQAKELGHARNYPLRTDWEEVKEQIMRRALRKKFRLPKLRSLLLNTGEARLYETSPFDRYWGVGKCGTGQNRLGILLMELRTSLAGEEEGGTGS